MNPPPEPSDTEIFMAKLLLCFIAGILYAAIKSGYFAALFNL